MTRPANGSPVEFELGPDYPLPRVLALTHGLGLVSAPESGGRRRWLDTFDRRLLARDGELYLDEPRGGRRGELVLRVGGDTASFGSGRLRPGPVPLASLPGEIQGRIAAWVRPRVLLTLFEAELTETVHSVIDPEGKNVCRLVEVAVGDHLRRLRVYPLRGYGAEAGRVASVLREAGAVPAPEGLLQRLLAAAGRTHAPGSVAYGRGLEPEMPAVAGVARALGRLLGTISANLEGTLGQYDVEFLHDLRVAVRRARTLTKISREVLPADLGGMLATELRWVGDLTTPARDLDVHLETLPRLMEQLDPVSRADLTTLTDLLGRRAHQAHTRLNRGLRSQRFSALMDRAGRGLAELSEEEAGMALGDFGSDQFDRRLRAVLRRGHRIEKVGAERAAEADLHDLRKRAKELRYTLEAFGEVLPDDTAALVKDLKAFQDVLGGFNDTVAQRELLRACGHDLFRGGAGPATLMAVGELLAQTKTAGAVYRRDFAAAFERVARWARRGRGVLTRR